MNTTLNKFLSLLDEKKLDAFLVSHDANIRYLTNFPASESWLLVSAKKTFYITDSRYLEEARRGLPANIQVKRYENSVSAAIFALARHLRCQTLGFDERHISVSFLKQLQRHRPKGIRLAAGNNLVEELRQVKTREEVQCIRHALKVHAEALRFMKKVIKPGLREKEVLFHLENFVRAKGVEFSFPPIVASGANSALPHARPSDRRIQKSDGVLLDMGIDFKGYKSDLTRMFFFGRIPRLMSEINTKVKEAQQKAIATIRPGVPVSDVDHQARNYLARHRLARYFGHSLGHGVGLEIHEAPRLSSSSKAILQKNMVVTVEPAVYLPHRFGIRIEDMVLVTQKGCEVLSAHID